MGVRINPAPEKAKEAPEGKQTPEERQEESHAPADKQKPEERQTQFPPGVNGENQRISELLRRERTMNGDARLKMRMKRLKAEVADLRAAKTGA